MGTDEQGNDNEKRADGPSKWEPEKTKTFWDVVTENPEEASKFITTVFSNLKPYADKFVQYKEDERRHEIAMEKTVSKFASVILTVSLVGTFGFGVLIGFLVYYHMVSADGFLFYVGVVMGFLLSLIRKQMPGFGDGENEQV